MKKSLIALALLTLLALVAAMAPAAAAPQKVDICHVKRNGALVLKKVTDKAVAGHLSHGDLVVGVDVDATCGPLAVAYWSFDDQTDPTTDGADAHDANIVGAGFETADIAPIADNVAALSLDGTDDYAWTPDPGGAGNLDGFLGLTLAAWINPDTLSMPDGSRIIISKYNTTPAVNTISYWLLQRGDEVEVFVARQRPIDEDRLISVGVDLVPGEWVHVAGTWDGINLKLYVDGAEVASKATTVASMDDSTVQVNIGSAESFAGGARSAFFSGLVDEVYVFDKALTDDEIAGFAATG